MTFSETEMFYLAISMVGTDFSMIGQLFPHRGRLEIKVVTILCFALLYAYHKTLVCLIFD